MPKRQKLLFGIVDTFISTNATLYQAEKILHRLSVTVEVRPHGAHYKGVIASLQLSQKRNLARHVDLAFWTRATSFSARAFALMALLKQSEVSLRHIIVVSTMKAHPTGSHLFTLHRFIVLMQILSCGCFITHLYQESVVKREAYYGFTPLHNLCSNTLIRNKDLREICRYIVTEHPDAVCITSVQGVLPIHLLLDRCDHPPVLEAAMLLLHEYPESFDMKPNAITNVPVDEPFVQRRLLPSTPSGNPFIQRCYLQETQAAFQEAVACTQDTLVVHACDAFMKWSSSCFQATEERMQAVQLREEVVREEEVQEEVVRAREVYNEGRRYYNA